MRFLAALILCAMAIPASAQQQTFSFNGLSTDDVRAIGHGLDKLLGDGGPLPNFSITISGLSTENVLTIGKGFDKLPREETDKNALYVRMQEQIKKQNQDWAKAQADAKKKEIDDAVKATKANEAHDK